MSQNLEFNSAESKSGKSGNGPSKILLAPWSD